MARKTSLTKQMILQTYDLLKEGHYNEDIAEYIGVHQATWYLWMNKGEELAEMEDDEREQHIKNLPKLQQKNAQLYYEFHETVKKAQVEAKMTALRNIRKAGKKSWQAEAWYLERKFRQQFGRVTIVEDKQELDGKGTLLERMVAGVDAIANTPEPTEGDETD